MNSEDRTGTPSRAPCLMGIDLGTSSVKTVLMGRNGTVLSSHAVAYPIDSPQDGFAEQQPELWWEAAAETIRAAMLKATVHPTDIAGVGFSGQMHGLVMVDEHHQAVRPAIIWPDRRSTGQIKQAYEKLGREAITKTTLNCLFPGFQLSSLLWIKENEPENLKKTKWAVAPKDYLRLQLCSGPGPEEAATEITDASATLAFDTGNRSWAEELITKLGLPRSLYPSCSEPHRIAGNVSKEAAKATGLLAGTPVVFGGADQAMQAVGNGIIGTGIVSTTIGTGGQVFAFSSRPVMNPDLNTHTFCHAVPGSWYVLGATLSAGLSLRWFRERISGGRTFEEMSREAENVPAGSNGLVFLPYLNGDRTPHLDPDAKGIFFGLTYEHTRAHMTRAIMEGVAFSIKESLEIIKILNIPLDKVIASGGGAKSPLWRQIQADVYGKVLFTVTNDEQACAGAAMTAGIGTGIYRDFSDACSQVVRFEDSTTVPDPAAAETYRTRFEVYRELYRRNRDLFTL